jgi:sugar phosphate isomerase/epimerase
MPTRREFLMTATAALTAGAPPLASARPQGEIVSRLGGPIGLQLYSLRAYLPKDLPGTLARIRGMGFREVEGAGLWGRTVGELKSALDAAGLRCQSTHMSLDRLNKDLNGALTEARAMGATWVVCPWIAAKITRDDTLRAAEAFNRAGKEAASRGMRFGYHLHGYEFVPSPEGTLFDTLAKATDPKLVEFQVDVFHTFHGGGDPVKVITDHGSRVTSLHLKDLKKGAPVAAGTPTGTPDIDVPVGTGQIDMAAVLRAARTAGVLFYYVEDESADPLTNIPLSVKYLQSVTT